ncbi:hypothetical protein O1L60_05055 [Streptomyces diastatochromogenes]|nr:hypothetical protein [Streptomyces diastatochromogenes]
MDTNADQGAPTARPPRADLGARPAGRPAPRPDRGTGPAAVDVTGEPGIGKTRLLTAFAAGAGRHGARVLHGRAAAAPEQGVPFQPFVDAFADLDHRDRACAPDLAALAELVESAAEVRRVAAALARVPAPGSCWSSTTCTAATRLPRARRPPPPAPAPVPVLLVLARRERQTPPALASALARADDAGTSRGWPSPLTAEDCAESLGAGLPPGLAQQIHTTSRGNPSTTAPSPTPPTPRHRSPGNRPDDSPPHRTRPTRPRTALDRGVPRGPRPPRDTGTARSDVAPGAGFRAEFSSGPCPGARPEPCAGPSPDPARGPAPAVAPDVPARRVPAEAARGVVPGDGWGRFFRGRARGRAAGARAAGPRPVRAGRTGPRPAASGAARTAARGARSVAPPGAAPEGGGGACRGRGAGDRACPAPGAGGDRLGPGRRRRTDRGRRADRGGRSRARRRLAGAVLALLPDAPEHHAARRELTLRRARALGSAGRVAESRDLLHHLIEAGEGGPGEAEWRTPAVLLCAFMERHLGRYPEADALLRRELARPPAPGRT